MRGAPRPPSSKSDSRNHQAILQPRRKAPSGCFQTVCLRRLIRPLARSYNILTDYDAVRLSLERSEPCANAAARKSGASANRRHGQSFPPARDYASSACSATFPYECPWQLEESTVLIIVICVTIMESYNRVVQPNCVHNSANVHGALSHLRSQHEPPDTARFYRAELCPQVRPLG